MSEHGPVAPGPGLRRNIYALGIVSFLTDVSSEMVYPLLPDLVAAVGGGAAAMGVIEGAAEATASVMKAVSGYLSDRWGKRKQPIFVGYLLSGLIKPLLGLAMSWPYILAMRFMDRMGKGIRTAPRDALIADSIPPSQLGTAFGLHRAMDTMGAVIGPVIGFLFLHWLGWPLNRIFFLAALPAFLGLGFILAAVKEVPPPRERPVRLRLSFSQLNPAFKRLVIVTGLFNLAHFPSVFLILRCRELGIGADYVMLVYLAYNLVYALVSLPAGRLSDRVGRRRVLIVSYLLFAGVFALGAGASLPWHAVALFMGYGVFQGLYEGAHRAFCADLVPSERRAMSYGVLHAVAGLAILPAGLIAGGLWKLTGPAGAFSLSAAIAAAAGVLFTVLVPTSPCEKKVASSQ